MFTKNTHLILIGLLALLLTACPAEKDKRTRVLMKTTMGDIEIALFDETPQHRDNFIKLVKEGFYDSLLFHRVIPEFMIQGGDPDSKNAEAGKMLSNGGPDYTVPAEFNPNFIHKKGALCAARQGDQIHQLRQRRFHRDGRRSQGRLGLHRVARRCRCRRHRLGHLPAARRHRRADVASRRNRRHRHV